MPSTYTTCKTCGADKTRNRSKYCSDECKHLSLLSAETTIYPSGSAGYLWMTGPEARSHPAAASNGAVAVHVKVAYDLYGPGPHACQWCDIAIDWKFGDKSRRGKIVVDHIDHDIYNNDSENLALSCHACNVDRPADGMSPSERSKAVYAKSGNVPVECPECGRGFDGRAALNGHLRWNHRPAAAA